MNFLLNPQIRRIFCLMVRQNFNKECEDALNKQINMELKACHAYLAMAYHFDRSDVATTGLFNFFKQASLEERHHAELIMEYMNKRGGQIILNSVPEPKASYVSAKEALIESLNMEKEVNQSLLDVHAVGSRANDPNLCDFIETNFLQEQVDGLKILADLIRQLERAECDLGVYLFDKYLLNANMHGKAK
uniref:Ferritin n=1 Tax=Glossina brevipalpis TaxID=37001 RepID=A0A1A9X548_9MUSC